MDIASVVAHAIDSWLLGFAAGALGPALAAVTALVLRTPALDSAPGVVAGWRAAQLVADALLVLTLLAASVLLMTGTDDGRYSAKLLVPRVVLAALAANASLPLAGALIGFDNAVAGALGADHVDVVALVGLLAARTGDPLGLAVTLAAAICAVLVVAVAVLRDVTLALAIALAPLALVTYALPQTDGIARLFVRAVCALLFAHVAQTALLALGAPLVGGAATFLPASDLACGLLAVALLYVLFRLPLLALAIATQPPAFPGAIRLLGSARRAWR